MPKGSGPPRLQNSSASIQQAKIKNAVALHREGRLADAERLYGEVLQRQPNHFDAQHLLGVLCIQDGRLERGAELIKSALRQNPRSAAAHNNLGKCLNDLKRSGEAIVSCDRAIELQPDYAAAHLNRGIALHALGRLDEATAGFDRAIALSPDYAEAHCNRAVVLKALNRLDDALASCDKAIALKPGYDEAFSNRGTILQDLRRQADALASVDRAIALNPRSGPANLNKGFCLLQLGRLEEGWKQHEWRAQCGLLPTRPLGERPRWLADAPVAGKTLFLWWEQGLGDTIQFSRYAKLAEARGAKVILSVQQPLQTLLKQLGPGIQVIGPNETAAEFDHHSPMMSLPLAFGTTLETIPAQQRYLAPDEDLRRAWAGRLPRNSRPRIGVVWSGRPTHKNDRNRSLELRQLLPIVGPDAEWFCLQKEIRASDRIALQQSSIANFSDDLRDFSDTAALVDLMDLVITVDTSVAHLAGAMGKPVWILLPYNPDWRWLLDRPDSPWYPSARLFRQPRPGDWASVIDAVRAALAAMPRPVSA